MIFMKKVYMYPSVSKDNQYIELIQEAIKNAGYKLINEENLKSQFSQVESFIFNWYEVLGNKKVFNIFIKKVLKILFLKFKRKKIIWVVHNKRPHGEDSKWPIYFMQFMLKISNKVIILSDDTMQVLLNLNKNISSYQKKIVKVPLPNYITIYGDSVVKVMTSQIGIKFLFIGLIRKYKNVELLLEVFNELEGANISLQITGICKDEELKEKLFDLKGSNANVNLDFRFISNDEMVNLISNSDIVVLPFDIESSLNSSTIMLAFSCQKTVISPLIATLKEYSNRDFFYSYEYENLEDHKRKLEQTIQKVINDYNNDHDILHKKGEYAYQIVRENNDLDKISEIYRTFI